MFGNNPVEKSAIDGDGLTLHVVEGSPFYTIQGEGPYAGQPAVFLRLHGCPLRCYFCDTEFSGPNDPVTSTGVVVDQIRDLIKQSREHPYRLRLLVITGGEPVRQNLYPIIHVIRSFGWTVQVETAGILWQDCLELVDIVVSPKTPSIHPNIAKHAKAFKYVIRAGEIDEDGLPLTNTQIKGGKPVRLARPADYGVHKPVYLSPQDDYDPVQNEANRLEVARQAMAHGYRAGLQLHKFLNLP